MIIGKYNQYELVGRGLLVHIELSGMYFETNTISKTTDLSQSSLWCNRCNLAFFPCSKILRHAIALFCFTS